VVPKARQHYSPDRRGASGEDLEPRKRASGEDLQPRRLSNGEEEPGKDASSTGTRRGSVLENHRTAVPSEGCSAGGASSSGRTSSSPGVPRTQSSTELYRPRERHPNRKRSIEPRQVMSTGKGLGGASSVSVGRPSTACEGSRPSDTRSLQSWRTGGMQGFRGKLRDGEEVRSRKQEDPKPKPIVILGGVGCVLRTPSAAHGAARRTRPSTGVRPQRANWEGQPPADNWKRTSSGEHARTAISAGGRVEAIRAMAHRATQFSEHVRPYSASGAVVMPAGGGRGAGYRGADLAAWGIRS